MIILQDASRRAAQARRRISASFTRTHHTVERPAVRSLQVFYGHVTRSVLRRLKRAGRAAQAEELFDPAEWRQPFVKSFHRHWNAAVWTGVEFEAAWVASQQPEEQAARLIRQDLVGGVDTEAPLPPPSIHVEVSPELQRQVRDWLRERRDGVWNQVGRTTHARIRRSLQAGLRDGDTLNELQARLRGTMRSLSRVQARRIARTECLPGHIQVNGANIVAAHRRFYEGPLVEVVTDAGRTFSGTPNHPMLSLAGWVGLGDLQEGDYLVCDGLHSQLTGSAGHQNVETPPATISEIFHSLATVSVPRRERTGKPDFHGDGMDGYVDILSPFGVLRYGRLTTADQLREDCILTPSTLRCASVLRASHPAGCGVPIDSRHRVGEPANSTASGHNPVSDDAMSHSELTSQRLRGLARFVPPTELVRRQFDSPVVITGIHQQAAGFRSRASNASVATGRDHWVGLAADDGGDLVVAQSRLIELDRVRFLRIRQYSGHVYNLTTAEGYFAAHGLYTGNTTGSMNFGGQAEREELGIELKEWVSTIDRRNRGVDPKSPWDHLTPNGQKRKNAEPFLVSGEPLMFPGDSAGSAGNVINCRCASVGAWE